MTKNRLTTAGIGVAMPIVILMALLLFTPNNADAGIYAENSETTYQELWIPHSEFTGHCGESGGKWFIEPWDCEKEMDFTLPNVNNINKIEIYIDLWRNRDDQSARFNINGGATIKPNVGSDWSRTPYIHEFTGSNLNQFQTGNNVIKFWDEEGPYHVHDVAIRVFGNFTDVGTTEGSLHKIRANGVDYDPYNPGASQLTVNSDQIQVSANVDGNADYVEFHAFYDGYDEDNDGDFSDWHNLNNNNWNQGASNNAPGLDNPTPALGGTINHIETVDVNGAGIYTATWNLPHVVSQSNVRFKVRIVDSNDNVRDAAGDDSRPFSLVRNTPSAYFVNPNFEDQVIHHGGDPGYADMVSTTIELPDDISDFDSAYLIGAFYANLYITVNDSPQFRAFLSPANHTGRWDLSITNDFTVNGQPRDLYTYLEPGTNTIAFHYWNASNQWGSLIEKPGPMIVLTREDSGMGADNTPPDMFNEMPQDGASFVETNTNISFNLIDPGSGVNNGSIVMRVNNSVVSPSITSTASGTRVVYNPPSDLPNDTDITVSVDACDNLNNCFTNQTISFRTVAQDSGATAVSDDFNVCSINDSNVNWSFTDPKGNSSATIGSEFDTLEIYVPGGSTHDPFNNKAPRLMQPASNAPNFVLETKFFTVPEEKFQMQGLRVEQDANNFIRFDMYHNGTVLKLYVAIHGGANGDQTTFIINKTVPDATRYILINRIEGDTWALHDSIDGVNWGNPFVEFNHNMIVNNVGLYAGNAASGGVTPEFTAVFDYIRDWGSPFVGGEDPESLTLPVIISGEGTVDKDIACGKPVTLTAVPELGWKFDRWSGAGTGSSNPITVNDWDKDEEITAHFVREEYTVTVDKSSFNHTGAPTTDNAGGTVQQTQSTYFYGDTVTLTAVPTPGWAVTSWSGAGLSGAGNTKSFTITGNVTVSVRFDQEKYDIDVVIDGPGNVNISDNVSRNYYIYGDVVTLTAVETNPEFKFRGWSGSIAGSENPKTVTVTDDMTVNALFSDVLYLYLPILNR